MTITVIIPTYNRAEFLERAVASCQRQEGNPPLDILVIDDGSTDDTPKLCARLSDEIPALRVIRQDNGGVAVARNTGLKNLLPETEFVTFLDSDDAFPKDRFSVDLPRFVEDPKLELTFGRLLHVTAIDPDTLEPAKGSAHQNVSVTQLSSGLYRRSLIERTGLFAEDMVQAEDTDFLYRIFEEGVVYVQTNTVTCYYVRHSGNMTNDKAESNRFSKLAMVRSIKRRREEPWRKMNMPVLDASIEITNT